jgi:hypothetical protein
MPAREVVIMKRPDLCACTIAAAIGIASMASSARADMQVLSSNVAKYQRGTVISGNAIEDLETGEWVRVRMLEDNTTRVFGAPLPAHRGLGTRGRRQQSD